MKSVVVGTAGHIDHGKSSLVQALTGTDPDRLKEEKARGITIDLGFAHWTRGDVHVAFVDVPGHERFVRNMLAGAGGIDAVLLVVAADESIMPQTREHFEICRLLGVTRGVVALTKQDLVDDETVQLVRLEVAELLQGTPLARRAGDRRLGTHRRRGSTPCAHALVAVAGAAPRGGRWTGAARLPIDRAFTMKGFGTVVTGTLVSGRIRQDDELTLAPGDASRESPRPAGARGTPRGGARRPTGRGKPRRRRRRGGRARPVARLRRISSSRRASIDARVELLASARPLKHGARVRFHQGTAELLGRVALLPGEPPWAVPPGSTGRSRASGSRPRHPDARRPVHPAGLFAGGDNRRRRRARSRMPPRTGIRTASARQRFERLAPAPGEWPDDRAIASDGGGAGTRRGLRRQP